MRIPLKYNISVWLANRLYSTTGKKRSNVASIIAILGTFLSLLIIILTLSIVNGFQDELKHKLFRLFPTVSIKSAQNQGNIFNLDKDIIIQSLHEHFPELEISHSYQCGVLLKTDNNFKDIVLRRPDSIELGRLTEFITCLTDNTNERNGLLISSATAKLLDVKQGDKIDIIIPVNNGMKFRRMTVNEIFSTDFGEFDSNLTFTLEDLSNTLKSEALGSMNAINIWLHQPEQTETAGLSNQIRSILNQKLLNSEINGTYYISTIYDEASSYFSWLTLIDTNIWIISILMCIIAAFTLICSLTIIILEHIPTIGILKFLGLENTKIKNIFLFMGIRIICYGIILSNIFATLIIWIEKQWNIIKLDPQNYYLESVPMDFNIWYLIIPDVSFIIIGTLVLLLPVKIIKGISISRVINFQ